MNGLKKTPYFIYLFIPLFLLINVLQHIEFINFYKLILQSAIYFFSITCAYFFIKKYANKNLKALTLVYIIALIFYFYFGDIQIFIQTHFIKKAGSYLVLILVLLIFILLFYKIIKNKTKTQELLFEYFNLLAFLIMGLQVLLIGNKLIKSKKIKLNEIKFTSVKELPKQNFYFLLFDCYSGKKLLDTFFHYDNTPMYNYLKSKNFLCPENFYSNYGTTIVSMPSILNLQYLPKEKFKPYNDYSLYLKGLELIENNKLFNFFEKEKFKTFNYSVFDLKNKDKQYTDNYFIKAEDLLFKQIFHIKIVKDLGYIFTKEKFKINYFYKKSIERYTNLMNTINNTIELSKNIKSQTPFFVYSHFLLPHAPFFTDSAGKLLKPNIKQFKKESDYYLEYLKYSNIVIKKLVNEIVKNDSTAIVLIMSDHGYFELPQNIKYLNNNNLMAIRVPKSKHPEKYLELKSNVNIMRLLLNDYFNQHLPMLKDSFFQLHDENNTFDRIEIKDKKVFEN